MVLEQLQVFLDSICGWKDILLLQPQINISKFS
jgi:hypothetical protein